MKDDHTTNSHGLTYTFLFIEGWEKSVPVGLKAVGLKLPANQLANNVLN